MSVLNRSRIPETMSRSPNLEKHQLVGKLLPKSCNHPTIHPTISITNCPLFDDR
jgi:hypothetical protein